MHLVGNAGCNPDYPNAGAAALLAAAPRCPTLAALDLSNNVIGRARDARMRQEHKRFCVQVSAADTFAPMLAAAGRCSALASLSLAYNYLADAEKLALCYAWGETRDGLELLHSPVAVRDML